MIERILKKDFLQSCCDLEFIPGLKRKLDLDFNIYYCLRDSSFMKKIFEDVYNKEEYCLLINESVSLNSYLKDNFLKKLWVPFLEDYYWNLKEHDWNNIEDEVKEDIKDNAFFFSSSEGEFKIRSRIPKRHNFFEKYNIKIFEEDHANSFKKNDITNSSLDSLKTNKGPNNTPITDSKILTNEVVTTSNNVVTSKVVTNEVVTTNGVINEAANKATIEVTNEGERSRLNTTSNDNNITDNSSSKTKRCFLAFIGIFFIALVVYFIYRCWFFKKDDEKKRRWSKS